MALFKKTEESFMGTILTKVGACVADNVLEPLPSSRRNRTPVNFA